MQSLKRTPVNKAATKPAQISALGVPWRAGVGALVAFVLILAFVHSWKWDIGLICLEFMVLGAIKIITSRDHNAFRRINLGVKTKFFSRDSHIWNGVAFSSFPTYPSRHPRGMY